MRNILKKLALLLVPVAAYFAVFIAFEPNNYFGLHKVTDSESSISRLKTFQREKGSRVIIGDSRLAHFDLDLAGQASGKTWQSLAFGGASLKENNDLLEWVLKENPDLEEVVYGLSFYTLNKSYNADRMATLEKTLANPFAYLFNLEYNVNMLTALSERLQGVQSGGAGETGDWQYPADYTDPAGVPPGDSAPLPGLGREHRPAGAAVCPGGRMRRPGREADRGAAPHGGHGADPGVPAAGHCRGNDRHGAARPARGGRRPRLCLAGL